MNQPDHNILKSIRIYRIDIRCPLSSYERQQDIEDGSRAAGDQTDQASLAKTSET